MQKFFPLSRLLLGLSLGFLAGGCAISPIPGTQVKRHGDEIVAAGQLFRVGAPVVLWMDPNGYDAYRVERRFSSLEDASWEKSQEQVSYLNTPNRYNIRHEKLTAEQLEQVRGGGWDLPLLQEVVDQFVLHYDVAGTARHCFNILHDRRGLSVHFLLDLDGTIYQTLDLKERAWHATISNGRSIGIEIANMGAYGANEKDPFDQWYATDENGETTITIPERFGDGGILTEDFVGRPARNEPIVGTIQGRELTQYDLTPEQYASLIKLTAALCEIFPKINCDYPRDESGNLITHKLPDEELENYQGVLGHFHIQTNKVDPGPAFQWDYVLENARAELRRERKLELRR
ncbi:MAG TPA: N-acetylmuramoyl-L-alanine amidase [Opitutales bacterium]|nr:N-acetylmuramoyl-L-alanine amidase [Opitutales bacterium]